MFLAPVSARRETTDRVAPTTKPPSGDFERHLADVALSFDAVDHRGASGQAARSVHAVVVSHGRAQILPPIEHPGDIDGYRLDVSPAERGAIISLLA